MNVYPRVATQPKAAPPPVAASSSTRAAQEGTPWRSELLQRFDAIHLSEMGHVALLRRTDTKYLMSDAHLAQALAHLSDQYRILEVDGRRLQRYQTLYFDTQDLALYRQHHDGRRSRYKVRERAYLDSDLTFWEIKHKVNDNTTIKSRVQTRELNTQIAREAKPFVQAHYPYPVAALEVSVERRLIELITRRSQDSVNAGARESIPRYPRGTQVRVAFPASWVLASRRRAGRLPLQYQLTAAVAWTQRPHSLRPSGRIRPSHRYPATIA